jgi:hypothetical protein
MFKTAIKALLLSTCISSAAFAQEVFKLNSFGGGFNFHVGLQNYDPSSYFHSSEDKAGFEEGYDTNSSNVLGQNITTTSAAEYKKPSGSLLNFGFQGFGVFNSFILGGEFNLNYGASASGTQIDTTIVQGTTGGGVSIANTSSRLVGTDVLLNMGFVALRKRGLIVYPMLGVGYGATGLWLKSESPNRRVYPALASTVTEEDPNLQNIIFWTRTAILDFGFGAQYMLGASTEDKAKGFSLGMRLGYKWQPQSNKILVNANKNVKDGLVDEEFIPSVGLSGFYVKLLIGFGKIGESN